MKFDRKISIPLEIHIKGDVAEDTPFFTEVTIHGNPAPDWLIGLLEDEYEADVLDQLEYNFKCDNCGKYFNGNPSRVIHASFRSSGEQKKYDICAQCDKEVNNE